MSVYRYDDFDYRRKGKAGVWVDDEIECLISFYKEEIDETPLFGKYRPIQSYYNISKKLKKVGYNRSPHQVRNKTKALRTIYYAAKRGTDLDRQNCFLYEELDKVFRDSLPDDCGNPSTDDLITETYSPSRNEISDSNLANNEIVTDPIDIYGDYSDSQIMPKTKKRRLRIESNKVENVHSACDSSLVDFMKEQLEKQRQHQLEITKIFTNAMTEQFNKFSNLITNLTQQMVDIARKNSEIDLDSRVIEEIDDSN